VQRSFSVAILKNQANHQQFSQHSTKILNSISHCNLSKKAIIFKKRIQIRIRKFLGPMDPDLLVRGMDLDPDPYIVKQNIFKSLDF
jgi:hypothetical protein